MFVAMQLVEYEPSEVLKGELKKGPIVASHYVVFNSATADKDVPQLSPELFKVGRELVVFLKRGPGKFWTEASSCKSRRNKLCAMVSEDQAHKELAEGAASEPVPGYTVENENCGVLPSEPQSVELLRKLLKERHK